MAAGEQHSSDDAVNGIRAQRFWPARWRYRILLVLLIAMLLGAASLWTGREQIAADLIDQALDDNSIEASYEIVSIGPQQQVFANFVIGDPAAPDLTVERLVIDLEYGFGSPGVGRIEASGARLFGSFRDGELSFGALDPLIFAESDEPPGLPALDLKLDDARARIDSDFGTIGIKVDGEGQLDDGFAGTIAATAPGLNAAGCRAETVTLYGEITTRLGAPSFSGPIRLRNAQCEDVSLASADIAADLSLDESLADADGAFDLSASQLTGFGAAGDKISGSASLSWHDGALVFQHDVALSGIRSPYGDLAALSIDGQLRSDGDPVRSEWSARIEGDEVTLPVRDDSLLSDARAAAEGTLAGPLLAKLERNLAQAASYGRFAADLTLRQSAEALSIVVPEARLRSGSGETLVSVSRLAWNQTGRLSGNIATGGEGLPRIAGRMEQVAGGRLGLRLSMQEYAAGEDRIAIPRMVLRQQPGGLIAFDGLVAAGGAIPGGSIQGLEMPISGSIGSSGQISLGNRCTSLRFERLAYFDLSIDGQAMRVCPVEGAPILTYGDALRVGLQTGPSMLAGSIADSPLSVSADNAVLRYPGEFSLAGVNARIGEADSSVRLTAATATGVFGDVVSGEFAEATAQLEIVPLNVDQLSGSWRYEDGTFFIEDGAFRLTDRNDGQDRFEPLFARDASLQLATNDLTAQADLREPDSDRLVTEIAIQHNLSSGVGEAAIDVPGIFFDDGLQPDQLTYLASGVIADVAGVVSGEGRVVWSGDTLTSTGTFGTEALDLAAAFGPVGRISGEIEFTDLLSMTTAPGQVLNIGSVNPGIEVLNGKVVYQLTNGEVFALEDGRWPFMGGELILRPVTVQYAEPGEIRYVFELIGFDAATFITQMEMTNLSASGTFDGTVPIIFDQDGNGRIEGGLLISRPPGGNVAYIGELTYEDMGAISNYAFDALRSLDYSQMSIELNGSLSGEIVTRLQFEGISQGEGATSNFVTRRLARLPIRFNINVRSENFFELATVVRSFFDPSFLGNPVDRGLFDAESGRFVPPSPGGQQPAPNQIEPDNDQSLRRPDESPVQPPESEDMP